MCKISRVAIRRLRLGCAVFALIATAVACYQSFCVIAFSSCVSRAALANQMSAVDETSRIDVVNAVCEKVAKRQAVSVAAIHGLAEDVLELALCIVAISFVMVGRDGMVKCNIKGNGKEVHWLVWLIAVGFGSFAVAFTARYVLLRFLATFAEIPVANESAAVTLKESLQTHMMLYERGKALLAASFMYSAILIGFVVAAFGQPLVRLAQMSHQCSISNGINGNKCRV